MCVLGWDQGRLPVGDSIGADRALEDKEGWEFQVRATASAKAWQSVWKQL